MVEPFEEFVSAVLGRHIARASVPGPGALAGAVAGALAVALAADGFLWMKAQ